MNTKLLAQLNSQQKAAVTSTEGPVLIIAGAGTGKTKVITTKIAYLINKKLAKPEEIVALTFTEKAASEMEERVDVLVPYGYSNIFISTFHSFGDYILRNNALEANLDDDFQIMDESQQSIFIRDHLFEFELDYFRPLSNPTRHVKALIKFFSRLKDEVILPEEFSKFVKKEYKKTDEEAKKFTELAKAYQTYEDLKSQAGLIDYGDQVVKTIELFKKHPKILKDYQKQFKYILVDEFQDTNYAQNELLKMLAHPLKVNQPKAQKPVSNQEGGSNITVVGDDDQCLPAGSLIDTQSGKKRIENIKKGDIVLSAIGKGSIYESKVSKIFSSIKKSRMITFLTKRGYKVKITDNHKMFALLPQETKRYYVYLMHKKSLGWRLGITNNLKIRLKLERSADKILAIKSCESENEARYYETLYALKYGIPTNCFKEREGLFITGHLLDNLYKELDVEKGVRNLTKYLGISINYHSFCLDSVERGSSVRVKVRLELCQRKFVSKNKKILRNPQILHTLSLETSNAEIINKLEKNGFNLNKAKKGKRLRITSTNIRKISDLMDQVADITNGVKEYIFKPAILKRKSPASLIVPASNVLKGFMVPVLVGTKILYDEVIDVKEKLTKGKVYDLEIEKTHNFIANGVVVHNSIFRFRGAAVSNILDFKKTYPKSKEIVLTKNYRSSQEILDRSYNLIQHNNPDRLEVKYKINKKLESDKKGPAISHLQFDNFKTEASKVAQVIKEKIEKEKIPAKKIAILVRANKGADEFMDALKQEGIAYKFSGGLGLYQRPEVRVLTSFINSITNTKDSLSFYHLATSDIYKVSPDELTYISSHSRRKNKSLREMLKSLEIKQEKYLSQETEKKLLKVQEDLSNFAKKIPSHTAGELLYEFVKGTGWLKRLLKSETPEAEVKIQNIAKFFEKINSFEKTSFDKSIHKFADYLQMLLEADDNPKTSDYDPDLDVVNIVTIHKSKGLEFEVVFMVNLSQDKFPGRRRGEPIPIPDKLIKESLPEGDYHIQEERRLFYVGMTRAKKELYFTNSHDYGGVRVAKLSQFVPEALDQPQLAKETHKLAAALKIEKYKKVEKEELPERFFTRDGRLNLSPHQIDDYLSCPLKFKYVNILKVPILAHHSVHYGSAIHEAIAFYFEKKLKNRSISLEDLWNVFENTWVSEGYITREHEEERLREGREALRTFFNKEKTEARLPSKIEEKFSFNLATDSGVVRVNGRFDIVYNDEQGIEVSDFKTSKVNTQEDADRRAKQSTQLSVYALAWLEMYGENPDKVSLQFVESGLKGETQKTEKDFEKLRNKIGEVAGKIKDSKFQATPSWSQCGICAFRDICPYTETKT